MKFQRRQKYSQHSFKALNFHSAKSSGEVEQRIAIPTSFCQAEILVMKCNWQDERISDEFRNCQDRQLNNCQKDAYHSTALPSIPRVLPETPSLSYTPLIKVGLAKMHAAIWEHRCKSHYKNQA